MFGNAFQCMPRGRCVSALAVFVEVRVIEQRHPMRAVLAQRLAAFRFHFLHCFTQAPCGCCGGVHLCQRQTFRQPTSAVSRPIVSTVFRMSPTFSVLSPYWSRRRSCTCAWLLRELPTCPGVAPTSKPRPTRRGHGCLPQTADQPLQRPRRALCASQALQPRVAVLRRDAACTGLARRLRRP